MVFGPGGRDHDSQNQFSFVRHQDSSSKSRNPKACSENLILGNIKVPAIEILNMTSIAFNKYEMEILYQIWDRDLQGHMTWIFVFITRA